MKTFFSMLVCILISSVSFSQEKVVKKKDTVKRIKLDEVIVTGNLKGSNCYFDFETH